MHTGCLKVWRSRRFRCVPSASNRSELVPRVTSNPEIEIRLVA